jgi:hypothetical protein
MYNKQPGMTQYNIIYISAGHPYLWNGSEFDRMSNTGREHLLYSGKLINDDNLQAELQKCRDTIGQVFPHDAAPQLKPVEIGVKTNKGKHKDMHR